MKQFYFFELPEKEKRKFFKKIIKGANEDQRKLMEKQPILEALDSLGKAVQRNEPEEIKWWIGQAIIELSNYLENNK